MTRLISLMVLLLLLPTAIVLAGDLPQVLQPNATAYSASEVATLTQAIGTLTEALNDYNMASRRYFSPSEWSSRDFAMYTAGVLTEKGYNTLIVSGDGWSDGVHTWVLVGIPLGSETAWVPVEASPDQGHSQQILGRIPSTTDATGKVWFDERYLAFTSTVLLSPNVAPIANFRQPAPPITVGANISFRAIASYDPDGDIVLFQWDFGDGNSTVSDSAGIRHKFRKSGRFLVTLTVVDNRGKQASKSVSLAVLKSEEETAKPTPGCGCGK